MILSMNILKRFTVSPSVRRNGPGRRWQGYGRVPPVLKIVHYPRVFFRSHHKCKLLQKIGSLYRSLRPSLNFWRFTNSDAALFSAEPEILGIAPGRDQGIVKLGHEIIVRFSRHNPSLTKGI
jgi:hypothetical protein